ncbi:MAG TPA: endonuclease domain-containing protein [Patescibacteria group bacterium]|nr:endonuclease domain-containing protein [Patescibacteria group bacterium]
MDSKLYHARKLRLNTTDVEKILWYNLRSRRLSGYKFRRQHLIGKYIVDFVCLEEKLIIELDGGQHNKDSTKQKDDARTKWLITEGYCVLRFWNNEILQNLDGVLYKILNEFTPPSS